MELYLDAARSPEERAKDLLARMDIEEKMAQVVGAFPNSFEAIEALAKEYPHGAGQVSCLEMRPLPTLEDAVRFQRRAQELVMAAGKHRIPAVFHMEGLCGAYVQGAASFPSGLGRASGWDPQLEEEIAHVVGRQERAVGITQTFAPVLDISRDSRMGRQGETYGEDPALASALGAAYTRGLQQDDGDTHSEAVAKHFLGFHAGAAGIHGADTQISERELREVYAKPFQAAIREAGLRGIMPCYCSLNGTPVSASKEILTDLLRDELGFDGVTMSDYSAVTNIHEVQKVGESFAEAGLTAMDAGMDVELPTPKCYNGVLTEWFRSGAANMAILDRAVERILTAKFRMGLFEHPFALQGEALAEAFAQPQAQEITLKSARQSLVLLKNDGTLPLSPSCRKIAVIGDQARSARIFFGGYTHMSMAEGLLAAAASMAGVRSNAVGKNVETLPGTPIQRDNDPAFEQLLQRQQPGIRNLVEELRARLPQSEILYAHGFDIAGNDHSHFAEALACAKDADLVLVTLGGRHSTSSVASMGEGVDATDIGLPECQETFLCQLEALGKPVVGVHFNGRPVSSDIADRVCNALVEAWNPAEKGAQAIVDVLLGTVNPSGKLTVSVARNAGQIPIYYNHPNGSSWHQGESVGFPNYVDCSHTPRYCFGHGLSYTQFSYDGLCITPAQDCVSIRFIVRNTGKVYGEEIAQLYFADEFASVTRPQRELAGFCRVALQPGEEKQIGFTLSYSQLAFWDKARGWKIEKGSYRVLAGASSEDIRLEDTFTVEKDQWIDGKTRAFYTLGQVEK